MTNQATNAFHTWNILTARANARNTITYGELAAALGMHPRPLRYVLAPIQEYCMEERLPPLTILVVNQHGRPGTGFIASDPDRFTEDTQRVYLHRWLDEPNPFEFARDGTGYRKIVANLLAHPTNTEDIYRKVKVRGAAQDRCGKG